MMQRRNVVIFCTTFIQQIRKKIGVTELAFAAECRAAAAAGLLLSAGACHRSTSCSRGAGPTSSIPLLL